MSRLTGAGLYTQINWQVSPADPNPNLFRIFDSAINTMLSSRSFDYDVKVPDTPDWVVFAGSNKPLKISQEKREIHIQKFDKLMGEFVLSHNIVLSSLSRFDHPERQNEEKIVFCGMLSSLLHIIIITFF